MEKYRILVVDDDEHIRLTQVRILQLEGFAVTAVSSGAAAIEELEKSAYDIMILDLHMEDMNGLDVLAQISFLVPNMKVIVLTGYASMDSAIRAIHFHVFEYLSKPCSPENLLKVVREALGVEKISQTPYSNGSNIPIPVMVELSNGVLIDCRKQKITYRQEVIHLTPNEAKILGILLTNHDQVISHTDLLFAVHGYQLSEMEAAKILRTIICRLRGKLQKIPDGENWIKNVRGNGYILDMGGKFQRMLQ